MDISFKIPGKLIERTVDEGDFVKKGQLIARLDRDQVIEQRARDQAGLATAESQLAQGHTSVAWQRATLDSDLALRQAEVRQAQAKLAELLAGSRPQEIQQARAAVDGCPGAIRAGPAGLGARSRNCSKTTTFRPCNTISIARALTAPAAVLKQAQERLAIVEEGPRKEDIEAAPRRCSTRTGGASG